jgi:hypothetical protein
MQRKLRFPLETLLENPVAKTFLTADQASGTATLTVQAITGFAINQILIIGNKDNEATEIIATHGSTAPTGSTITLVSNLVQSHNTGDWVQVIDYDQIDIYTSPTLTGTKTLLTTLTITPANETVYSDTATTTGYYFSRYKNSITSAVTTYSDGVPVTGYSMLTARSIIDNALHMIGKESSELYSDEYGFESINNCQGETIRELKRWSFMQEFGYNLGSANVGSWRVSVPSDIDDPNTNKSIYNFVLAGNTMKWVDKEEWNAITAGVAWTTLATNLAVGNATVTLTDSSDFDDAGTIRIGTNTISYTANARTTGILTLSAVSTVTGTAGDDVFQNETIGTPTYFTVYDGYIWHYPIVSDQLDEHDYMIDYYKTYSQINSDGDTIVIPDPTVVQYYVAWKFKLRQQNGEESDASQMLFNKYLLRREKMKQKEVLNRKIIMKPTITRVSSISSGDNKSVRLQGFLSN